MIEATTAAGVGPGAEETALVIRVWTRDGDPRIVCARLLTVSGQDEPRSWCTVAGETALVETLTQWVRERLRAVSP